jgi:hypothetical protein
MQKCAPIQSQVNHQVVELPGPRSSNFYRASNPSGANPLTSKRDYGESVFARALRQLEESGRTRHGDTMKPPSNP